MKQINDVDILLINNHAEDAAIIINALQQVNLANKLVHLKNGEEGLNFIFGRGSFYNKGKRKFPRLIILDVTLPVINGIEVLRNIKANEITRIIPVVVLTGSNEDKDLIASYNLAVNSFVIKPSNTTEFTKVVCTLAQYWLLVNHMPIISE